MLHARSMFHFLCSILHVPFSGHEGRPLRDSRGAAGVVSLEERDRPEEFADDPPALRAGEGGEGAGQHRQVRRGQGLGGAGGRREEI